MRNVFNPEMLILGRELRGMTQAELAEATFIGQGLISRYENGMRDITSSDLQKIAETLDLPEGFFYRTGQIYGPETSSIYHRKRQSVSAKSLKEIYARLNLVRQDIKQLLDIVDIDSPYQFPKYDPAEYEYDIPLIASLVRTAWNIPKGPVPSVISAIEDAGGIVVDLDLGTPQIDAIVQWIPPVPPVFLVNSHAPGDRLRFTLAHEIGHIVMHHQPIQDMEDQANQFAAAFLMPQRDIAPDLNPVTLSRFAQLKPKWKVSIKALMRRARDLGKITDRKYRSMIVEFNKMGYRIREPIPVSREKPELLREMIEFQQFEQSYSMDELQKLFTMHRKELEKVYLEEKHSLRVVK